MLKWWEKWFDQQVDLIRSLDTFKAENPIYNFGSFGEDNATPIDQMPHTINMQWKNVGRQFWLRK